MVPAVAVKFSVTEERVGKTRNGEPSEALQVNPWVARSREGTDEEFAVVLIRKPISETGLCCVAAVAALK
jgi:hypothetical protein